MKIKYRKKFLKELSKIPPEIRSKIEFFVFEKLPESDSIHEAGNIEQMKGYPQGYLPSFSVDRYHTGPPVGGYYKERGLSDGALQWMIHKAESAGVQFKENRLQNVHPDPTAENALHNSRKGFWKLWKSLSRNIQENALVHRSTLDRINADIGYKPKNLPNSYTVVPNNQP